MSAARKVTTTDGDEIPVLTRETHDVTAAIALLEYARTRGFIVGPRLTVGSVTFQVADLRQMKQESGGRGVERQADVYETNGMQPGEYPAEGTD